MMAHLGRNGFQVGVLLVALLGLPSCTSHQAISVRADGSALVSTGSSWGLDKSGLYRVPYIHEVDTSGIHGWTGGAVFIIDNIDSLGKHLSSFSPGQLKFKLTKDQLSIKADSTGPMPYGWNMSYITIFLEQGIVKVKAYQKTRPTENQVTLRIGRRQMIKHPDTVDFTIQLKPAK